MSPTFSQTWSTNWRGLEAKFPEKRIRQRFDKASFDALKQAYVEKYGYSISIPQWDDIVHLKPTELMTPQEIRDRKLLGLQRILASPAPEWGRNYASAMTWIDNIQDTSSVIYPFFRTLVKWNPGIFGRLLPVAGWGLLFYDFLQLANMVGRMPMAPLKSKRAMCEGIRNNPFTKQAQWKRMDRIAKWNPGWADILQVLQVTDQFTGVGLSLGSIVGFAQDLFYGAYRKVTGQKVQFRSDWPKLNLHELNAAAAAQAAAFINSSGQVFSDEQHFWTLATWAASISILTPLVDQYDLAGIVDDPLTAMIDAPTPTDPITIEVIKSQGLSLEDGVGWPMSGEKRTSLKDLTDYITPKSVDVVRDYVFRHRKDAYGFMAAHLMDQAQQDLLDALEPGAEYIEDDTPAMRVYFEMLKYPIIPTGDIKPKQAEALEQWINDFTETYEHIPRIREVTQKMADLGMSWKESYPQTVDPSVAPYLPPPEELARYD